MVDEIVGDPYARFFHVTTTRDPLLLLSTAGRPQPTFVAPEDVALVHIGLADLVGRPPRGETLTTPKPCQTFLKGAVDKLWERVEAALKTFSHSSVAAAAFEAIDELARDAHHWNLSTRAMLALPGGAGESRDAIQSRRSDRARAAMANRLLIETAQYACPSTGLMLNRADHLAILADITVLLVLAHTHDAIAYGYLRPEIHIHPNGEIEADERFLEQKLSKYLSHKSAQQTEDAAARYEDYFDGPPSPENRAAARGRISKLNAAFEPEYGFDLDSLFEFLDKLLDISLQKNTSLLALDDAEMHAVLAECGVTSDGAGCLLSRFALPLRRAWNAEFPPGVIDADVFPWRFRRQLSLLARPILMASASPCTWIVSTTFFRQALAYIVSNIESASFPHRFFRSAQMLAYWGTVANQRGHEFAQRVATVVAGLSYFVKLEVEMTAVGAPASEGLGDIDVLAWSETAPTVFVVECKHLRTATTTREVIQMIEEFSGDMEEEDSLARHLRRVEWLKTSPQTLALLVGKPAHEIRLVPLLVTSETVPMQFFSRRVFPTNQVVPIGELSARLRKV